MRGFQQSKTCSSLLLLKRKVILFIFFLLLAHPTVVFSTSCDNTVYPWCTGATNKNCYGGTCHGTCVGHTNYCNTIFAPGCDTVSTGDCVPCSGNSDCSAFSGTTCRSNPSSGYNVCAKCILDTDCASLSTPECSQTTFTCGVCTGDAACAQFPSALKCDISPGPGNCVECIANTDCTTTALPVCTSGRTCTTCSGDGDCYPRFPSQRYCDTSASNLGCVQCRTSADCLDPTAPVCSGNVCTGCSSPSDCDPTRFPTQPHCSATNACVECLGYSDCTASSPVCNSSGACASCTSSSTDCNGKFSGLDVCDTSTGACVICASNTDCPLTTSPACVGNVCTTCSDNAPCGGTRFPSQPVCDVSPGPGDCVECTANTDCMTPALPVCSTGRTCSGCTGDPDCSSKNFGYPYCYLTTHECIECQSSTDCTDATAPVCSLSGSTYGSCGGCSSPSDCPSARFPTQPYCDLSGACVECLLDADCNDPSLPMCHSGVCSTGCSGTLDCGRFSGFTACNTILGTCVECYNSNTLCTNTWLPKCVSDVCSACTADGDCSLLTGTTLCTSTSGGVCGECKGNTDCGTLSASQCDITSMTSTCIPCTDSNACTQFSGNKFCRSGYCGECDVNTDCTTLALPRCDTSPSVSVCATCSIDSDCNHVGKLGCVLGVCYDCSLDNHCPLTTDAFCDPLSGYTCVPCTSDTNCLHLAPSQYCAVDTVCKKLKAEFSSESFDRITPQRRISYTLNVDTYPLSTVMTYTWTVSETSITQRTNNQNQIQLRNFETMSPLPTSITFTYLLQDSAGNTDTITRVRSINHPPTGGTLTVSPSTGEGLNTIYTLTTTGWTDADGDTISYKFYYATNYDKNYTAIAGASTLNTLSTVLPPGLLEDNYVVYIKVTAEDPYYIEGSAEATTTVTFPIKTVNQVLTALQAAVISSPTTATSNAVIVATYLGQAEDELTNSPLSACGICWYHGSCSAGTCVCNSGYTGPGCSLTTAEYNDHINLKDELLDIMINDYASLTTTSVRPYEQSYSVLRSITSSPALVPDAIATKALTLLNTLTTGIVAAPITVHYEVPSDAASTLENLFALISTDCSRTSTFATSLVSSFNDILQSLSTMEIRQRTNPSPYVIETKTLYICIQTDILAFNLKGLTNLMCNGVSIEFTTDGVIYPDNYYVDILLVLPKSNYYNCGSSLSLSPYAVSIKAYKTQSTFIAPNGGLTVVFPSSLSSLTCTTGYELVETAAGDLACQLPVRADNVQSLITGSNLFLLGNIGALADFDILRSVLFYIVVGFTLLMTGVSIWSVHKDKNIDRDVIILPKRSPSKFYRLMVYLMISHTFFGIFALFDKKQPRIMRSVLFYIKVLGLMAVGCVFNQSQQDLGSLQKNMLSVITLLSVTPINLTVGYLVFKRQLEPKVRRKRLALQGRRIKTPEEKEAEERAKKRAKMLNKCGYSLVVFVVLGYLYVIFVITANNAKLSGVISKWLQGFVQSWAIDFFGVQIVVVFVHLGIIETLQHEHKKKFLCIPRKHLPKMVNPNIFDYKKRFAALDRLYKEGGINSPGLNSVLEESLPDTSPNLRTNRINSILKTAKSRNQSSANLTDIQLENTMERIDLGTRTEMTEIITEQSSPERRMRVKKNRSQGMNTLEENSITETLEEGSMSPNRRTNRQSNLTNNIVEEDQSFDNNGRRDSDASPGRRTMKRQSNFAEVAQQVALNREDSAATNGMDSEQGSPSPSPMRRMRRPNTMKILEGVQPQVETDSGLLSPGWKAKRNSGMTNTTIPMRSDASLELGDTPNPNPNMNVNQNQNPNPNVDVSQNPNPNADRRRNLTRVKTLQGKRLNAHKHEDF